MFGENGGGTPILFPGSKNAIAYEIRQLWVIGAGFADTPARIKIANSMFEVGEMTSSPERLDSEQISTALERQRDYFNRLAKTFSSAERREAVMKIQNLYSGLGQSPPEFEFPASVSSPQYPFVGPRQEEQYPFTGPRQGEQYRFVGPRQEEQYPFVGPRQSEQYPFVGPRQSEQYGFVGPIQDQRYPYAVSSGDSGTAEPSSGAAYRYPFAPDPVHSAAPSGSALTVSAPGKTPPKQFWGKDLLNLVNSLFGGWSEVEKINMQKQLVLAQQQGQKISLTPQQQKAYEKYLVWGGLGLVGLAAAGLLVWALTKKKG